MSNPIPNPVEGEFYRFLAKIIIQLINSSLKDSPQREWYFTSQNHLAPIINQDNLGGFARTAFEKKYPWAYIKKIVDIHVDLNQYWPCITYAELADLYPCEVMSDSNELEAFCDTVIKDNPKSAEDYRKGKVNSINHLKGQIMKLTKGKADVRLVTEILERKLK